MFGRFSIIVAVALVATATSVLAAERKQTQRYAFKASRTIGLPAVDRQAEELGKIHDLLVCDPDGRVTHIIISSGGVLSMAITLRPVPIEATRFLRRGDDRGWAVQVNVERKRFEQAPLIEQDDWTTLTRLRWSTEVDRFYAVEDAERHPEQRMNKVSNLTGTKIMDRLGKDTVGSLTEIVFENNTGKIRYGALSFGGFLGFGEKLFAIPWESLAFTRPVGQEEVQHITLTVEVSEVILREAEGIPQDKWPATADERFLPERDGVQR
jgi:sporulation protein YlmC with PRC-barrel domain